MKLLKLLNKTYKGETIGDIIAIVLISMMMANDGFIADCPAPNKPAKLICR